MLVVRLSSSTATGEWVINVNYASNLHPSTPLQGRETRKYQKEEKKEKIKIKEEKEEKVKINEEKEEG